MEMEFKGLEALIKKLDKSTDLTMVQKVVKKNGADLEKEMKKNAKFKGHYRNGKFIKPTGNLKRSIKADIGPYAAKVKPTVDYAAYVEFGTRFMSAQPYVRPSYWKVKNNFIKEMKNLVR